MPYATPGRIGDAKKILAELFSRLDQGDSLSTAIAQVYIRLGNKDQAFDWLRKAILQKGRDLFLRCVPS